MADPNLVPQEIAQPLGVREAPEQPLMETLTAYLRSRELLLLLDNCEHLIEACARIAETLLAACPGVRILATSIEGLGLFHETIWQVPSLPLPQGQAAIPLHELKQIGSIQLFNERAGNASSAFSLNERNAAEVVQICRRLDGIPLAIELAAARIKMLSLKEITARLDDRFSLLTTGSRTDIPRHQTLRATIDWSHDLLSEPERVLFRRLSVFAGSFTLDAAETVCGEAPLAGSVLDLLAHLVDKSLVLVEPGTTTPDTRYRLLETLRQYGWEKVFGAGGGFNSPPAAPRLLPWVRGRGGTTRVWFRCGHLVRSDPIRPGQPAGCARLVDLSREGRPGANDVEQPGLFLGTPGDAVFGMAR